MIFQGCATALITPFKNNKPDFAAIKELIEFQIGNGVAALVILGTTGEPSVLTPAEREEIIRFAVKTIAKRVPAIVGIGTNNTETTVGNALEAEMLGADALLVVTPYYNRCSQRGLVKHFKAVADSTALPIILYNVPGRTGVDILPATYRELMKIPNIAATKEACGKIDQISETAAIILEKMDLYSGDDGITLPILSLGGKGVISVAANIIPRQMSDMVNSYLSGDIENARRIQFAYLPLFKALFYDINPIPVKTALKIMGKITGDLRLPLCEMDEQTEAKLLSELKNAGIV